MVSPSSVSVMRVPSGLERVSVRLAVPGSSGMKLAGSSIVAVSPVVPEVISVMTSVKPSVIVIQSSRLALLSTWKSLFFSASSPVTATLISEITLLEELPASSVTLTVSLPASAILSPEVIVFEEPPAGVKVISTLQLWLVSSFQLAAWASPILRSLPETVTGSPAMTLYSPPARVMVGAVLSCVGVGVGVGVGLTGVGAGGSTSCPPQQEAMAAFSATTNKV